MIAIILANLVLHRNILLVKNIHTATVVIIIMSIHVVMVLMLNKPGIITSSGAITDHHYSYYDCCHSQSY